MATNSYGLDTDYLEKNLQLLIDRLSHYKPDEAARALFRLAIVADKEVINAPEFTGHLTAERDALQAKLDGGVRVYAHPSHLHNATLILD